MPGVLRALTAGFATDTNNHYQSSWSFSGPNIPVSGEFGYPEARAYPLVASSGTQRPEVKSGLFLHWRQPGRLINSVWKQGCGLIRRRGSISISLDDDSNDSLKDNYINEADSRDDPSVDISSDIRKSAKSTHASNSTRNLRTNSHQKQTQRPKNVDQTSKKASSCNDGVDTMDITSSVSLKNRLRSRKKKHIIIDTLDLTDEVSLPVKPSPVIIDNLILSDDEMIEPGIESSDKSSTKQSYDQSEDLVNPEITIMVHWRCLDWKKFTIRKLVYCKSGALDDAATDVAGTPEQQNKNEENPGPSRVDLSPEDVRPYPKAAPRCLQRPRKKVKSRILTESPVKNKIEEETLARASRKEKSCSSRPKVSLKQKELFMKKRLVYSSSDSDGEFSVQDSSDEETLHDLITVERNDTEEIVVDDFVLTEFATKKTKVLYVGHVEEVNGHTYKIRFMRRFRQTWKFTYPETEDISEMERSDIVMKLPQPESSGGTARIMTMKNFHVDFSSMKEKIM
uniref:Uncharacterized protein n=1 Tax=Timema shepardi TaxID=629360 RepID=A0A7R9AL41_TIMSH|nr:unnamed protein product [Timema shepardi]